MTSNGDTQRIFKVGGKGVRGLGSFHKTLKHDKFGEVDPLHFEKFVQACEGNAAFRDVPFFKDGTARFTNPQAGLAHDRLTGHPATYSMPPAPTVLSTTTAAEMTELYWMAILRDLSFDQFSTDPNVAVAAKEVSDLFKRASEDRGDPGHLMAGVDAPGSADSLSKITPQNLFRMGLPGEEYGPLVSQFFVRDCFFGTQTINQRQLPYKSYMNFLTDFQSWLDAQNTGKDAHGQAYPQSNEHSEANYERKTRYIGTMRDLARFVNKDALHQAYFNATLLLLSGGAKWNYGNPYGDMPRGDFGNREAGFGTLGGPHILALVSEVATRALKIVWNQKWQVHLRLRPEAYGGLVHVQTLGVGSKKEKRPYGLPAWISKTEAAERIKDDCRSLLLPMAFTAGSPTHPAYGAGHATVAGACVTILKAFFQTFDRIDGKVMPKPLSELGERSNPYGSGGEFTAYQTGKAANEDEIRTPLPAAIASQLTIEGELNKLASNVALGRSMGGVHWRTDNTRSLVLGEAIASHILADITVDLNEKPYFEFRSFARKADGQPKMIKIHQGRILVDGMIVDSSASSL